MGCKVELKLAKLSHAKRFIEILDNPNFIYFQNPPTLKQQKAFLCKMAEEWQEGISYFNSIFYKGIIVGACGLHLNHRRKHIAEIGFFVDYDYWGMGIATSAVRELEWFGFNELELERIEILIDPDNAASERVAVKCEFQKEGLIKKAVKTNGKYCDVYLYAKVK